MTSNKFKCGDRVRTLVPRDYIAAGMEMEIVAHTKSAEFLICDAPGKTDYIRTRYRPNELELVPPKPEYVSPTGIKIGDQVLVTGNIGGSWAACNTGDIVTVENIYVSEERGLRGEEYITVPGTGEPGNRSWMSKHFSLYTPPAPEYNWIRPTRPTAAQYIDQYMRVDLGGGVFVEGYVAAPSGREFSLRSKPEVWGSTLQRFSLDEAELREPLAALPTKPGHYLAPTGDVYILSESGAWTKARPDANSDIKPHTLRRPKNQPLRRFTLDDEVNRA